MKRKKTKHVIVHVEVLNKTYYEPEGDILVEGTIIRFGKKHVRYVLRTETKDFSYTCQFKVNPTKYGFIELDEKEYTYG